MNNLTEKKKLLLLNIVLFSLFIIYLIFFLLSLHILNIVLIILSVAVLYFFFINNSKQITFLKSNEEKQILNIKESNNKNRLASKSIIEYNYSSSLVPDFLRIINDNVNKASEPLSHEIYEIKNNVNKLIEQVNELNEELLDEKSKNNYKKVVELYNTQINDFTILFDKIKDNNKALNSNLKTLSHFFSNFEKNISLIESIASNIKILSLNASVESARAGESGRGFKVIADETKKLSESTKELINNIIDSVEETKQLINITSSKQEQSSKETLDKILTQQENCNSFHHILTTYYNQLTALFSNILSTKDIIYEHTDKINPTFQLHDIITQQVNNLATLISHVLKENNIVNENFNNKTEKENILDNMVNFLENTITTSDEVNIINNITNKYGLKREIKLINDNTEIELF